MKGIKILATGYALANRQVDNDELRQLVDTNDEWIRTRTGIVSRRISEQENTSDLAVRSAQMAIDNAKIDPESIDCIVVATFTPDCQTPSTACLVQGKLNLQRKAVLAFDLNGACSGFLMALETVKALLDNGSVTRALVIGAEVTSKIMDWSQRSTCVLFGDGAGAFLVEQGEGNCYSVMRSQGDCVGLLQAQSVPLRHDAFSPFILQPYDYTLKMNGPEVFRFAVKALEEALTSCMEKANVTLQDIDLVLPHQANRRILDFVSRKMKIPAEKMVVTLDCQGNTSAASIPMSFALLQEDGKIVPGMKLLMAGFGAGLTWCATYLEL